MTAAPVSDPAPAQLAPDILAWIAETAGGRLTRADRVPGGGRHEAWLVDVDRGDGQPAELFLRYNHADPTETGDPFTLHRETQFYLALQGTPVPVPRILGVHPVQQAVLSARVPGDTWFSRLRDEDLRLSVARDFMRHLAALHAVDPHSVDLADLEPDADLRTLVHREIDVWEQLYRQGDVEPEPLVEFGLGWLRRNVPDVAGPVAIVQGDTGPGNFLYRDGAVTAILDWELAHLGDPHDDLGWLALRAVQEPFTTLADRFADYAEATGRPVDLDRVRYYRVFAEFRVVVLGSRRQSRQDLLGEVGNGLIYSALHRRLFVEAMADVMGVDEGPATSPGDEFAGVPATERSWLYDAALAQLREVIVPRSTDAFVVQRAKGLARLLKYLQQTDRLAVLAEERETEDLAALLGARPSSVADGRSRLAQAIRAGEAPADDAVLRLLVRRVHRETELLRPAMGVLADRHFDPLES
jgi:aminoglycoside phosphotransferase (APT) family kinase protein